METNLFSSTFRAPPGYPGKIPGYPAKKFGISGFGRTYRTFWPPPLHVEDPHPTRKYPDRKVWVWVPLSSLTLGVHPMFFSIPHPPRTSSPSDHGHPDEVWGGAPGSWYTDGSCPLTGRRTGTPAPLQSGTPTPAGPSPPPPFWEGERGKDGCRGGPSSWLSLPVGGLGVGIPLAFERG